MRHFEIISEESTLDTLLESGRYKTLKLGDTTIILEIDEENDAIHIASIRTPIAKRKSGSARAALQYIIDKADVSGITLTLGASPLDDRTKLDKLVQFYRSMGFQTTGRSINYAGDPEMIRKPQTIAKAA
jgi:hypothetical protein